MQEDLELHFSNKHGSILTENAFLLLTDFWSACSSCDDLGLGGMKPSMNHDEAELLFEPEIFPIEQRPGSTLS
jgi:hypothetical protein